MATQFPDVKQVGDSIVRFTRNAGNLPFAVYYLDIADDLPGTQEKLTKYQDRVIGSHYFEGKKSLQWNNYLYFVTSEDRMASSEVRRAKELIERDRRYARKFVISEEELDSALTPPVIAPADASSRTNVLSIWINRLVEAGLDKAILSDEDIPKRLELIESSSVRPRVTSTRRARDENIGVAPFIRSMQLKRFRPFPLQRGFEFGTVNLIFGINGSGKTSLLEAIELFYCGRNKRNPDASRPYELTAVLADGLTQIATAKREQKQFRDLNLTWYGQSEVKTNNLYRSFAQFNFLDTDAAAGLASDGNLTSRIEEDLSKLLVGPDASVVWRNIVRVGDALSAKLRELRPLETQIKEDIAVEDKRLTEAAETKQESDSIRTSLEGMIHHIGWHVSQDDKEGFAESLVKSLLELLSIVQQAVVLDWAESPASIDGLANYCREAKRNSDKAETDIARLKILQKNQKRLTEALERDRKALDLAKHAKRLIAAGVLRRAAEMSNQQNTIATYSDRLAGLDTDALSVLSTIDRNTTVAKCHKGAVKRRSAAEASLASTKKEYAMFSKLRDQSSNLAQELRQVASRILQNSAKPDECPLCHTQFGPGELSKHINVDLDEKLEAVGQALLARCREQDSALRDATAVEAASRWLRDFCKRASLAEDISIESTLSEVQNAKRMLSEARSRIEVLDREIFVLKSQGLSVARLEELLDQLHELGYPLGESSQEAVDRLLMKVKQRSVISLRTIKTEGGQADKLRKRIEAALGTIEIGAKDFTGAVAQLKERLVATESVRAKLANFTSSFPWPRRKPLAEFAVEVESIRRVAVELQAALGKERQAKTVRTESIKRKAHLERQLVKLKPRIERLNMAQNVLDSLKKEYPLKKAMEFALQQNREGIETIFLRIHSPAEFTGLGSGLATLVRRADNSEAALSEISTGQRAAFALSIFLAQNAQLTIAPPVVLMDDPIANVDDLNSLSFLDYLRELVLSGRRQIFFATANNKLAALFERKFDFLGTEGFRKIELTRDTQPIAASK